jgi:hypothetical protein
MLDFQPRDIPKDFAGAWRQMERLVLSIPNRTTIRVPDVLVAGERNIVQHGQATEPKSAIVQPTGAAAVSTSVQIDGIYLYVYVSADTTADIDLVL